MEDCDVYISDYLYLSNVQRRICEKLFACANYCAVFMVCNDGAENSRIYPSRCLETLVDRAKACGCLAEVHRLPSVLKGDKSIISKELFAYGGRTYAGDGSTRVFVADSAEEEVKRVAREIRRQVVREGYRFKDFAVVCCDTAVYAPIVERVFENVGISYFFDKKQPLETQAATRLVCGAFRTVAKGFRRKDVIEFAKNALLGLDYFKVCAFENFCIKYGIDNLRTDAPFKVGTEDAEYAVAEEIRATISDYLSCFTMRNATAAEYYEELQCAQRYGRGCCLQLRDADRGQAERRVFEKRATSRRLQIYRKFLSQHHYVGYRVHADISRAAFGGQRFRRRGEGEQIRRSKGHVCRRSKGGRFAARAR